MNTVAKRQRVATIEFVGGTIPDKTQYTEPAAEEALIGAVINRPAHYPRLAELIKPADFSNLLNGYIWWAFDQLTLANKPIDIFTVPDHITHSRADLKDVADLAIQIERQLVQCVTYSPDERNIDAYISRVLEAATRIRVLRVAEDIKGLALDRTNSAQMIIDGADRLLREATNQSVEQRTSAADITGRYFDRMETAMRTGVSAGIPIGFEEMDKRLGGLLAGEITVIAGPAGVGKTTVVLSFVRRLMEQKIPTAFYSLEMTDENIIQTLIAMQSGLDRVNLARMVLSKPEWSAFVKASGIVSQFPLQIIDDYPQLTPEQLRISLRAIMSRQPVQVVVIDGLWLMHSAKQHEQRRLEVKAIVEELHRIARDFNIPILLIHQLNRAASDRSDKRPMLSDLSESIAVSQTVENVLGLYRPTYYDRRHIDRNTYALILKARNVSGGDASFILQYDSTHNLYTGAINE